MRNISPASVVVAGPGSSKRFTKSTYFVVPLWQQNANHRLDRATGGDPQDHPASGSVGAAPTFSPAQAVSSQAGNLYGFSVSLAGSRNPSLYRFGFLGRCHGLARLKSHGSSLFIQYPCAFFSLFFALIPATLTLSQPQGRLCLLCSLSNPKKKLSLPAVRAKIH